MFKLIKSSITLMVAVCLVLLLSQGAALGKEKILRTSTQVDITTLDPCYSFRLQDKLVLTKIFEGMVTFDLTDKPPFPVVLQLAESYDISKDAKTLTFKLRKGVQFHHGYGELTSEDVVFTYQRQLSDPAAYAKTC